MKRSRAVSLACVSALAAAFTGCGGEEDTAYCVDREDRVVDNDQCGDERRGGGLGYFWLFGGRGGFVRGDRVSGGERVSSLNKPELASRGGFGGSAGAGGVGRSVKGTGGGFFSGGG